VPGLVAAEPCHEQEVGPLLDVCLHELAGSIYLRLVTPPVAVPFELPTGYRPAPGQGVLVRPGSTAVIVGYGPILLSEAFTAAEALAAEGRADIAVANLPWLNLIDEAWLTSLLEDFEAVVLLDNH